MKDEQPPILQFVKDLGAKILTPEEALALHKQAEDNRRAYDANLVALVEAHYTLNGWRKKADGIIVNGRKVVDAGKELSSSARAALEGIVRKYYGGVIPDAAR